MAEIREVTTQEKTEFVDLRKDLYEYDKRFRQYPDAFLAYYKDTFPEDYAALDPMLEEANTDAASTEDLEGAIQNLDDQLSQYQLEQQRGTLVQMLNESGFAAKDCKIVINGPRVEIRVPCAGDYLNLKCLDTSISREKWQLDGVGYSTPNMNVKWGGLEEVLEDAKIISTALDRVKKGELKSSSNTPFSITEVGLLRFDESPLHNVFENTFEADDYTHLAVNINARYRALRPSQGPAVASKESEESDEGDPLSHDITMTRARLDELAGQYLFSDSEKLTTLKRTEAIFNALVSDYGMARASGDFVKSLQLGEDIKEIYHTVLAEWEANYVAPKPAPAGATADTAPSSVSSVSSEPEAAPEEKPGPKTADEFYASLTGEEWKKYATLSETGETGSIVMKGLDKGTPAYALSRINHFFGTKGVAKKLATPATYEIKVGDKGAEWKVIPGYPEGTLVESGTENRFWVENGTKIEWGPIVLASVETSPPPKVETVSEEAMLRIKADEVQQTLEEFIALTEREKVFAKRELEATRVYGEAKADKKGVFETKMHREEELASAKASYDLEMSDIKDGRAILAQDYRGLQPALAAVDPRIFEGNNAYAATLISARQLVAYRDGTEGVDAIGTRTAKLESTSTSVG